MLVPPAHVARGKGEFLHDHLLALHPRQGLLVERLGLRLGNVFFLLLGLGPFRAGNSQQGNGPERQYDMRVRMRHAFLLAQARPA